MLNRLYGWYGKRMVRSVIVALVLLICVGLYLRHTAQNNENIELIAKEPVPVTVESVQDLAAAGSFSVVGTVTAVSEAKLETEAGGRVTNVSVGIGDFVGAGTILATIENSRERAQLLQAEGAYESALASSKSSETNLEEAKVGARNTYREVFTKADTVVRTVIDQYYSNPASPISGLRISGSGNSKEFLDIRKEIERRLDLWSENISTQTDSVTEDVLLDEAESTLTMISDLTARFALILADTKKNLYLTDTEREARQAEMAGARTTLDMALASVSSARRAYEQAEIGGAQNGTSQSSALLKSALGALRSAEAAYEKTLVRSPISGTVNALYLKAGEYVQSGQPAAIVANNGSLEVSTALGESDVQSVHVGDTVRIGTVGTGTVTRIAPAVDPLSGKSEVKINVGSDDSLKNGSTVSVTFTRKVEGATSRITVPLSALKFLPSGPVAFGVSEEGILVSFPVTVGPVLGNSVEILEGLTFESRIVSDARGLKEGSPVTVINQ